MTTATDQVFDLASGPGHSYDRNDGNLIEEGRTADGKSKNIFRAEYLSFHDNATNTSTGCGDKRILHGYGRVTPVGNAILGDWPIGSEYTVLTIVSGAVTACTVYKKVATGSTAASWRIRINSASAPTHITVASNSVSTIGGQTTQVFTISGITIGDIPVVSVASVGSLMGASTYMSKYDVSTTPGVLTVTFSQNPGVAVLNYVIMRPIANTGA
jgi:hypothetical protein